MFNAFTIDEVGVLSMASGQMIFIVVGRIFLPKLLVVCYALMRADFDWHRDGGVPCKRPT